jgi:hypothetical protein
MRRESELISQEFFGHVVAYVKPYTPFLNTARQNASGNCPFCQRHKLDSHHRYFGVWCHWRKVYLGCRNPSCNFGTSNNILDFIQRIEDVDFPAALAIWQEFLGAEPVSKERYLTCLNQLHKACQDAFSGNGKYKQNYIIRISKRTLIEDFGWHHRELFSEVFKRMVVLYFDKASVNQKYVVQMMANRLQRLLRQEIQRAKIEISEHRLSTIDCDMNLSNDILDYVSYDSNFTDPLIEREDREREQKALKMAKKMLDDIEMQIIDGTLSLRRVSIITGIPKSTIADRLKKKLEKIKTECLKT